MEELFPASYPTLEESYRACLAGETLSTDRILVPSHLKPDRWLRASLLPIDQFLLTVAQDAFTDENDLALAHSLAVAMRRAASQNPTAAMEDFAQQLRDIAENRQKFLSSMLFDPPFGRVAVDAEHAGEYALDVAVEDRVPLVER